YIHAPSRMFMYWDTEPRMPWQLGTNYYEEQKNTLEPEEFERIHRNRWVSAKGAFIEAQWWDNCESPSLPVLKQGDKTPVVVAIDMSVSNDLAAMVAVTRDPINPDTCVAVRAVKIFNPKKLGGNIDQEQTVGNTIREWASRWNVINPTYNIPSGSPFRQLVILSVNGLPDGMLYVGFMIRTRWQNLFRTIVRTGLVGSILSLKIRREVLLTNSFMTW